MLVGKSDLRNDLFLKRKKPNLLCFFHSHPLITSSEQVLRSPQSQGSTKSVEEVGRSSWGEKESEGTLGVPSELLLPRGALLQSQHYPTALLNQLHPDVPATGTGRHIHSLVSEMLRFVSLASLPCPS